MFARNTLMKAALLSMVGIAVAAVPAVAQEPVGTGFTHQGMLKMDGGPLDQPADLRFSIFDSDGGQVGTTAEHLSVPVSDGLFTVELDFGVNAFVGDALWLEVAVAVPAGQGQYVTLTPRQPLTAAPYAVHALNGSKWQSAGSAVYYDSGNVGIGLANPGAPLHVVNSNSATHGIRAANTSASDNRAAIFGETLSPNGVAVQGNNWATSGPAYGVYGYTNSPDGWAVFAQGNVGVTKELIVYQRIGIGTTSPAFTLEVNGSAGKPGGGSWSNSSDRRLKKNIRDLHHALDTVLALRGVTYEYKNPKVINELPGERIGMIAQEVEVVMPDWVDEGPDGFKRLTFRGFEAMTVEALRELRAEKDAEIAELREENAVLKARLDRIEARLAR